MGKSHYSVLPLRRIAGCRSRPPWITRTLQHPATPTSPPTTTTYPSQHAYAGSTNLAILAILALRRAPCYTCYTCYTCVLAVCRRLLARLHRRAARHYLLTYLLTYFTYLLAGGYWPAYTDVLLVSTNDPAVLSSIHPNETLAGLACRPHHCHTCMIALCTCMIAL